jgi:hypothetical protein
MPLRYVATPSPDGGVAPVLGRLGDFQQDLLVLGVFSLLFLLLSLVHLSWRPRQA